MKIAVRILPWIILAFPFVVSVFFYNSLDSEILITRSFFGNETMFAPKSLFTVFRVPMIEVICAAAIETIRPKSPRPDYFSVWNVLLYAIALKSLFQVLEFISSSVFHATAAANFFFYATLAIVIAAICLVTVTGRNIFSAESRKDWKAANLQRAVLVALAVAYFILAFAPALIFKTA